jgi:predicted HTH domain antitoxin
LSAAAQYADIRVYHMMTELANRNIEQPAAAEKFVDGLKTLVETL